MVGTLLYSYFSEKAKNIADKQDGFSLTGTLATTTSITETQTATTNAPCSAAATGSSTATANCVTPAASYVWNNETSLRSVPIQDGDYITRLDFSAITSNRPSEMCVGIIALDSQGSQMRIKVRPINAIQFQQNGTEYCLPSPSQEEDINITTEGIPNKIEAGYLPE